MSCQLLNACFIVRYILFGDNHIIEVNTIKVMSRDCTDDRPHGSPQISIYIVLARR